MAELKHTYSGGFRKMFSFGFTCLIYHATTVFCKRVYPWKEDPLGKTSGQMVGAARSARQNIVEASTRAGTSKETEIRLLDVARGSLAELQGDYEAFLIDRREEIWSIRNPMRQTLDALRLENFTLTEDVLHEFSLYMAAMRDRFAPWLENEDPVVAANSLIVIIDKAKKFLYRQILLLMEENSPKAAPREKQPLIEPGKQKAPTCPLCGKVMQKRLAKSGKQKGKSFWGCSNFPECKGVLKAE